MSDAKKLPSGKWRNLLYVGKDENGKRIYESFTADTKKEANLMAMERARELEQGIRKDRAPSELTLGEAIDKYIEERTNILSPKTIREYKIYRKHHAMDLIDTKLKNLTPSKIQQMINNEARTLKPKTVHNVWGFINSAITNAVPEMQFSPTLPEKVKTEFSIPKQKELIMLLDYVEGKGMEIPVLLAAFCGLRRGEISALDLSRDVDYENNRITVREAMSHDENNNWGTKSPKEFHSFRTIDAPPFVIEKLRVAKESGYKNLNPASITKGFVRIRDKLGLPVRFHDLRHYFASVMLSVGVPDKYAMQRMGHSTPNMLKRVYQHLIDETDQKMTSLINNYFENVQHDLQHEKEENPK